MALGVLTACLTTAEPTFGQVPPAGGGDRTQQLQREQRLRDLDNFYLDRRIKANELVPVGQRAYVDYGVYLTLSYLTVRDADGENRGERIYEATGYGRVNIDGVHELFARGRYAYFDYLSENDSFDGRGSRENDDKLDRAFYRFDLGNYLRAYEGKAGGSGLAIQAGRDLVYWANGLTLGQTLDGVIVDASAGPVTLQAIAGITPEHTVDIDASRPNYDQDTRRAFFGGILTVTAGEHQPFAYVLVQRDNNDEGPVPVDAGFIGTAVQTRFRYNSYYLGVGSSGSLSDRVLYGVEAVYQAGNALSSPVTVSRASILQVPQSDSIIQAAAINARIEYLFPGDHKTRATLEQTFATGDRDRQASTSNTVFGNVSGTRDRAFNAFGLINPGLAFSPNLSNLSITRLGLSTFPLPNNAATKRLQMGIDVFLYNKLLKTGALDEGSDDGRFLGFEPDLYLNWQATSDITLTIRYGYFFPSDNLTSNLVDRSFFYAGVTYAF